MDLRSKGVPKTIHKSHTKKTNMYYLWGVIVKLMKVLLTGLMALSLVACGETDDAKTQNRAESLVNEYNQLVGEVNSMGSPDVDWSEQQLSTLEDKLYRMKTIEIELNGIDGTSGVSIYGGENSDFIDARLAAVSLIRSYKASQLEEQQREAHKLQVENQITQLEERYEVLRKQYNDRDCQITRLRRRRVYNECEFALSDLSEMRDNVERRQKLVADNSDVFSSYERRRYQRRFSNQHDMVSENLEKLKRAFFDFEQQNLNNSTQQENDQQAKPAGVTTEDQAS